MPLLTNENRSRIVRFLTSCLCIAIGMIIVIASSNERKISSVPPGLVYVAYLISSGIIIIWISKRLFDQHQVLRFKFDLANMILATSLFALPFAASNFFLTYFEPTDEEALRAIGPGARIAFTLLLAFLMFPVFFFLEALLIWCPKPTRTRTEQQ